MLDKSYRNYKYIVHLEKEFIGSIHSDNHLTVTNYISNEVL